MATTQTPVETEAPESPAGLTHKQIRTIIIGLMAGMLLAALDQTIVSTAIRTIGDELHGLGDHRLPDHVDRHDAALREVVGHLRAPSAVPDGHLDLHHRVVAERV